MPWCWTAAAAVAVSYTHLDVYKRQILELLTTVHCWKKKALLSWSKKAVNISGLRSLILHRRQEFWNAISMKTISPYRTTTIDVYKRQRLQQSLLSAVKISMKNTSSWNTRQILKSSDSGKSPPKLTPVSYTHLGSGIWRVICL